MKKTILALALALAGGGAHALPLPSHVYEFSGGLSDAAGGPAMIAGAGSAFAGAGDPAGLRFAANLGPTVSGAFANPGLYSIEMFFSIDQTFNWRRLVDFKNGGQDEGFYLRGGNLAFYGPGRVAPTGVAAGQMAHVVLTRDASETVRAYFGGIEVFSFADAATDYATFSDPNGIARFFRDDGTEASSGFVDFIRFYGTALGASDVAALYGGGAPVRGLEPAATVPEPGSLVVLLAGLCLAGVGLRSRREATATV